MVNSSESSKYTFCPYNISGVLFNVIVSQYEWYEGLPVGRIVRLELVLIPLVGLHSSPAQEYQGEQGEPERGRSLGNHGVADPLRDFSHVVGAADKSEHSSVRDLVPGLSLFPQTAENSV